MLIHFFLVLLILFLWGSAYFFYKKGHIFLQFLNENNKEKNYQSKINSIVWFQIIAGLLALICFILDQPKLDLLFLITLFLASAGIGFSLIKN